MISIPIILFSAFGVNNDLNLNSHYYGFIVGTIILSYCIFEESGWRGYLQDELKGLKPILKYLIIGVLWYAWHLTFIIQDTSLIFELKMLSIFILVSWGIGQIAAKTHSILASSCFHFIGSILGFSPLLSTSFDSTTRYIICAIALSLWILIMNTWDKKAVPLSHTPM
jgi:membrane protease YdiL (CAAX protease family)